LSFQAGIEASLPSTDLNHKLRKYFTSSLTHRI